MNTATTTATVRNLMLINDSRMGFEIHGATCPDIKKKSSDLRERFTASTMQEALEYAVDEDMQEMGYTHDHIRVMGCCHFAKAAPAAAPKAAPRRAKVEQLSDGRFVCLCGRPACGSGDTRRAARRQHRALEAGKSL